VFVTTAGMVLFAPAVRMTDNNGVPRLEDRLIYDETAQNMEYFTLDYVCDDEENGLFGENGFEIR